MVGGVEAVAEERMPSFGWLSCSSWTKCGHLSAAQKLSVPAETAAFGMKNSYS
jgi:hypothetical protein